MENIHDERCNPENRVVKVITAEIVSVLKEITKLNPLLRDQIVSASIQFGNIAGMPLFVNFSRACKIS